MTRPASLDSTPADLRLGAPPRSTGPRRLGRASRAVTVTVAAAGLALVAGCTATSPSQTLVPYQPADGVALDVGTVKARDLLIVASAKGATGVLSGSVINTGTENVTVRFAGAAAAGAAAAEPALPTTTTTITLRPRQQLRISTVEIPSVAAAPGALTPLSMTTSDGTAVASVPVLLPTEYYSTLTPTTPPSTTPTTAG
ncbi:hypothetical protein V3N99_07760 [Dermatophilaceae bacterium Soc4.6]